MTATPALIMPARQGGIDFAATQGVHEGLELFSRHRSRRRGIAPVLLGVMLAMGLCHAPAQATGAPPLKKIRFMLDWYPQAETGGYYYALVHNYYKDAGLDVSIIPASPGISQTAEIADGVGDISMAPGDQIMIDRAKGLPLVCIMTTMQHDPKAVMVHDESPVKDFPDLQGHAVAVAPGTSWFLYITKKYHLTQIKELRLNFGVANFLHDPNYIQESFVTSEPFFLRAAWGQGALAPGQGHGFATPTASLLPRTK